MKKNVLVVGGTRGLGYELAKLFAQTNRVIVTGRTAPTIYDKDIEFRELELDFESTHSFLSFAEKLPHIETLVIAAGYAQFGGLGSLHRTDILQMTRVGFLSPIIIVRELLHQQQQIPEYLQITSTSQWVPRANEPVYAATKAGIGMFAESMAGDPNIGRVMVASPSGMKTAFWNNLDNDTSQFLEPAAVANAIRDDWSSVTDYDFRHIGIQRNPLRVEVRNER